MRLLLLAAITILATSANAQPGCLHRTTDEADNAGYADAAGTVIIPTGKYPMCYTDAFCRIAFVSTKTGKLVAIDRKERILFEVFVYDNGPDYPSEGLFRIVRDGKIGYADTTGQVIIQPRWDGAFPFENGLTKVCTGCTRHTSDGEHWWWSGGYWFTIDRQGRRVSNVH